jgi:hypothetical protein
LAATQVILYSHIKLQVNGAVHVYTHQVAVLFDRWAALVEESPGDKVHAGYVQHLQQAGFLKVKGLGFRF